MTRGRSSKERVDPGYFNLVGVDLQGKTVRLRQSYFKPGLQAEDHLFRCTGGFGCSPVAIGRKVFGVFLSDGEEAWVDRGSVECVVEGTQAVEPKIYPGGIDER